MTTDMQREARSTSRRAALAVVGIGIRCPGQVTLEARRAIERADIVLFGVADAHAAAWLRELNDNIKSFAYPLDGRSRHAIYRAMAQSALAELDSGKRVCAVFYGSPSALTQPARQALKLARQAGYAACLLPAVSFLECLFVDLSVDPGEQGCQIYEASAWLRSRRVLDPYSHLILCQPAVVGAGGLPATVALTRVDRALELLRMRLAQTYPASQRVVVYEAATSALASFRADELTLAQLPSASVTERSTLYVPPVGPPPVDHELSTLLEQLERNAGGIRTRES
jgi:uncharacterized protein YabN with tetrapyrrole methylase and pyrophosphatase domain